MTTTKNNHESPLNEFEGKLFSVPEARQVLGGIGHTKFYDLVKGRKISLVHIGRRSFVTGAELARFIDGLNER